MNNEQKARALKMVLASLEQAGANLTESHARSALAVVSTVAADKTPTSAGDNLSPVDIAQLILQILQIILGHLPGAPSPAPTPAPAPIATSKGIDPGSVLTIAETIMQILELILANLPKVGSMKAAASGVSATDIAQIILEVLQLLLSKIGTQTPKQ